MPAYQNSTPPNALFAGEIGFSFNNETFPGSATAGSQFALGKPGGYSPETGYTVRWQTIFGGAPSAVNLSLQVAINDVDAEYQSIDSTSLTTGDARTVTGVQGNFLRIRLNSSTGGTGLTAKFVV
jgi:hypothetical protein